MVIGPRGRRRRVSPARPRPRARAHRWRIAALAAPVILAGCASLDPISPELSLDDLRTSGPTAYYLGERFQDVPLTAIVGTREGPTVVYGGCDAGDAPEAPSCVPPVQLAQQPIGERHPALYDEGAACSRTELRGVPAAWISASYLDLFAGDRTITVYADTRERALAAVDGLRSVDGSIEAGATLPAPTLDIAGELARCAPG